MEGGDYVETSWVSGHDFSSARKDYDAYSGRSYEEARSKGKTTKDLLPQFIETSSSRLLVLVCDQTGSMGDAPATMFSKFPYLVSETEKEYMGPDAEISVGAFGDAQNGETYPVQARPPAKGKDVKTRLTELVIEARGGSNLHESSELAALYYARNVRMPENAKPIFILVTDEMPYDDISREMAATVHVTLQDRRISTKEVFDELKRKYAVYLILKPYGKGNDEAITAQVRRCWLNYIDEDHIAPMPDADRVVDIIFGILAAEAERIDYFHKEIEARQTKAQVATVYRSLETIHARFVSKDGKGSRPNPGDGKSTMFRSGRGKKVDDLL